MNSYFPTILGELMNMANFQVANMYCLVFWLQRTLINASLGVFQLPRFFFSPYNFVILFDIMLFFTDHQLLLCGLILIILRLLYLRLTYCYSVSGTHLLLATQSGILLTKTCLGHCTREIPAEVDTVLVADKRNFHFQHKNCSDMVKVHHSKSGPSKLVRDTI